MKNLLPILIIGFITFFAFSCKSNKETAVSTADMKKEKPIPVNNEPQLLASIERTPCYGRCPTYKATFMDNGEVRYVGRHFVERIGTYSTLISAEEVLTIKNKIAEYHYFKLDSLYPTPITDFPSSITEVNLNGERKKVINRRTPPPELKAFEEFLDGLLEEREWEKLSDETEYEGRLK